MLYPRENAVFKSVQKQKTSQDAIKDVSVFVRFGRWVFKTSRQFCQYTSIHGFNHIAAPGRMWLERILWIAIVAGATWGAVDISLGQWLRYRDNPTVVTVEKDFRSWTFAFPAVTVCVGNKTDPAKVQSVIQSLWNLGPSDEKYAYYQQFVRDVANTNLTGAAVYQQYAQDKSLDVDLFKLVVDVMPALDVKTSWWNISFVSRWTPVMTEAGACYVTNSVAIADIALRPIDANETKDFPQACTFTGNCYIVLEVTNDYYITTHSPYDVANFVTPPVRVHATLQRKIRLSVTELGAGAAVRDLDVRRRSCLYLDEAPAEEGYKKVYSASMCQRKCRYTLAMKHCQCKPHYYFYEDGPPCTPAGMACLAQHAGELLNPKCPCMLQCVSAAYSELLVEDTYWTKGPFSTRGDVRYMVQAPRTRYTREIVFTFQDLIVSLGGAAGLFLGASFISFVEIFYFAFKRIYQSCFEEPDDRGAEGSQDGVKRRGKTEKSSYEAQQIEHLTRILDSNQRFRYNHLRKY
ncbi:pickpocket protein 28-like isoform X2 [Plutella xylostella]|uniref:pickpocket protein 28-like isoform X2 n=1 Tax=Plutella xylostella TaxID=51655 RepID=UPI0020326FC3|nr:pickpocket protein 28-like isoform X2 [Plutella xylostella]